MDLRSVERRCYGTGELDCHCGGDLCVCELNGSLDCPGCPDCPDCPDCRDSDNYAADYPDEPEDKFDEADRRCEKQAPGQCNLAGSTYCEFHCPYHYANTSNH